MKYNVGDRVRIKSLDWYNQMLAIKDKHAYRTASNGCEFIGVWCGNRIFKNDMIKFCGQVMTIKAIENEYYIMHEDTSGYWYCDEMIEGLVEEESSIDLTVKGEEVKERIEITIPEGYEYVIESDKIIFTKKKKEYPKTFLECCDVLNIGNLIERGVKGYKAELFDTLQKLYICRDAYWKIAGEEMGLGKPWEPSKDKMVYSFYRHSNKIETNIFSGESVTFEFPTEEIRDTFKKNFDPDIEICKEFL